MECTTAQTDVDEALTRVRELAAGIAGQRVGAHATVWETVKAMEEKSLQAVELAQAVQELDACATRIRQAPREWSLGRDLTPEQVRELIERHPEIAPLGENFVLTLARRGFRAFQMEALVRTVRQDGEV
ncbi:hypothetical protein P1P68_02350 [Streptomyces scabiei]|uniref:hypothetical protein n=1 Tax=Streptomyces scabiei TaxID=1930 RepID=UPI00298FF20E|nr:hypothetical protein [Streptomyces scabiei]MDW8803676.1 hypothetical protein [Streptomyces scabiei]